MKNLLKTIIQNADTIILGIISAFKIINNLKQKNMEPDTTLPKTKKVRVYTALLSQVGTSAPTAIVLQNTLGANVTWTRNAAGVYVGTCTGQFDFDKTTLLVACNFGGGEKFSIYSWSAPDSIAVETQSSSNVKEDDMLSNNLVEIKIYE